VNPDREDRPLALDDPDEAQKLRAALDRAGYEPQRIAALLKVGAGELSSFHAAGKTLVLCTRRTAGGTDLDTLVRLFVLGAVVEPEAIRRALESVPKADGRPHRVVRIQDTLNLVRVEVSDAYQGDLAKRSDLEATGPAREVVFDAQGNLPPLGG